MRISILFQFYDESRPAAVTEVEGAISDILLPEVGDTVCHRDLDGRRFRAHVLGRHFDYSIDEGEDVDGAISVLLSLKRLEVEGAEGRWMAG